MSRAFVKETDGDEADSLPERPQSPHANYVTAEGLSRLQRAVRELMERKAGLAGDTGMSAQQQLKQVERDLRYFEERGCGVSSLLYRAPLKIHFLTDFMIVSH